MQKASKTIVPLAIVLTCSMAAILLWQLPFFHTMEHKTIDWRIRFRAPDRSFGKNVMVILLDEPVMDQFPCRSPVPRGMLASLIHIADEAGARLIALDVFLKNLTFGDKDRELMSAIKRSGKVVLGSALRGEEGQYRVDLPHQDFLNASFATGLADFPVNPVDQRVRALQVYYEIQGKIVPALSSSLFLIDQGARVMPSKLVDMDGFSEKWPPMDLDALNRIFINYQGPPAFANPEENIIRTFPASAVLTGLVPDEWFKNKIVLIGAGYADNADAYRTPFYSSHYDYAMTQGVEIHANALATILAGKTITFPPLAASFLIILTFSLILLLLERRFNTITSGIVLAVVCSGYWVFSFIFFERTNLALPIIPFLTGLILTFILMAIYRSLTEGRQKRWIKNAFQMYLSPEFVNILLKKPERLFLGGEEKELTILFSDLKGFTSLSEGISPAELVSLLNEYLDGMTQILFSHEGTLDKYEGDAVMAFWGAPLEQHDHARKAVNAALEMLRFSDTLSQKFQREGRPPIKTRIGLNTGKVVVGNIGSQKRFDYTIVGDEVNLTSRLESANKQYGTYLMISHSIYTIVKDYFLVRELDNLSVKGKTLPVKVYEVLGLINEDYDLGFQKMLECYHQGYLAYSKRQWKNALELFEEGLGMRPDDGPTLTYVDRCRYFLDNPPSEDWNGVFRLETK
ncbi:MAG: adenylate/guanylate cyclase domain-containing protein [Desulfobacteraceae bacterium]|nr:adenylate/guanylate cyclase domain-containing protein [Desulfobacteraceae bacterium]